MTSRRKDFLSTAVEQLRYHVQKLESAATHMMAACGKGGCDSGGGYIGDDDSGGGGGGQEIKHQNK